MDLTWAIPLCFILKMLLVKDLEHDCLLKVNVTTATTCFSLKCSAIFRLYLLKTAKRIKPKHAAIVAVFNFNEQLR